VNARHRPAPGFSLVELMVALALGLFVVVVIGTVFDANNRTSRYTEASNDIQAQGRIALDLLRRDLRVAGFRGCNSNQLLGSGQLQNLIVDPTDYNNDLTEFLRGYTGTTAAFSPAAPGEVTGGVPAAVSSSDAVTIRVPIGQPRPVNGLMASAVADIPLFTVDGLQVGDRVVIADCAQSSAFRVTGFDGTDVRHQAGLNQTNDLGRAFGPDAMLVPFATVSYYVGLGADGTNSLFRRIGTTAISEEVAAHVDEFRIEYGIDTTADLAADQYLTAEWVTNWDQVVSVRASLLLRSQQDGVTPGAQQYNFDGRPALVATDRRLRRPYTITVHLRNRTT
jgi:type IV pilus assembly protein PilW